MFNPSLLGYQKGPAYIKSKSTVINDYWKLINIPFDIPKKTAVNNVSKFLTDIIALEIPSSLMCNCNCTYCYIREKWLKNTVVALDEVIPIVEGGWQHLINFGNNNKESAISLWGAEPFCNIDTLEYIINFCKEHKSLPNLSTNGTILNDKVKDILYQMYKYYIVDMDQKLKVPKFQVSLDGPKKIQDKFRPMYSGQSNYDKLMEFLEYLNKISIELEYNERLYGLCGTIYLDDSAIINYIDSVDFFTDINNPDVYSPIIPIRIENSRNFTKEDGDLFYKIIKKSTDFIIHKSKKTGEAYLDFYATKLFLESSRVDGWPRCSACNTQVAIDIDGTLYMCHGPITTSKLKPLHNFGNLFEGIIDYRRFISVLDRIYSDTAFKSICKTCKLFTDCADSICTSCPPTGDANNDEPVNFNINMCNTYKKCFSLWKQQYDQFLKVKDEEK